MKIYDITKTNILDDVDLQNGYLREDAIVHHIEAVEPVEEVSHYEIEKEYQNGGKIVRKVVDVERVVAVPAHDEIENIKVYVPYTEQELEEIEKNKLRIRRQSECFSICDRAVWYDSLTDAQKNEVKAWRQAWLNVTETKVIPEKPEWIE